MSKDQETIPLCDLQQQYHSLRKEIEDAVTGVLSSGAYVLGPNVRSFEHEVAEYLDCQCAVGVGSGTDALHLVLRALEIGPGDEVITTPFTFIATTEAIGLVGAKPVFVDIDRDTYNIDPLQIEAAISSHTKAILPVHLYGQPCDMDAIMEIANQRGIPVIEDCAQAMGAAYQGKRVGTFGLAGCFSFFPSKNLGCYGDGGMVTTNNRELADRVEMLRRHGGKIKYHHDELGLNSRLDEIQAAVLRVKLKHLDLWNARRRAVAYEYNDLLTLVDGLALPRELLHEGPPTAVASNSKENLRLSAVYHQYTIQVEHRDKVAETLKKFSIQSFPYYPVPLHLQKVHDALGNRLGDFPLAESAASHCLSLPMFPELTESQQNQVASRLREALAEDRRNRSRAA